MTPSIRSSVKGYWTKERSTAKRCGSPNEDVPCGLSPSQPEEHVQRASACTAPGSALHATLLITWRHFQRCHVSTHPLLFPFMPRLRLDSKWTLTFTYYIYIIFSLTKDEASLLCCSVWIKGSWLPLWKQRPWSRDAGAHKQRVRACYIFL